MKLFALLGLAVAAWAQTSTYNYVVSQSTSLSAAAEVVTVQLNAAPTKLVTANAASVYCSAACTFQLERDGSAASTTALTIVPVDPIAPASQCAAYHSSNVGSGTVLSQYTLGAGQMQVIDLSQKHLTGSGQNLTIRTNSITGTVQINIQWSEK